MLVPDAILYYGTLTVVMATSAIILVRQYLRGDLAETTNTCAEPIDLRAHRRVRSHTAAVRSRSESAGFRRGAYALQPVKMASGSAPRTAGRARSTARSA